LRLSGSYCCARSFILERFLLVVVRLLRKRFGFDHRICFHVPLCSGLPERCFCFGWLLAFWCLILIMLDLGGRWPPGTMLAE